jgi:hypothetical protein
LATWPEEGRNVATYFILLMENCLFDIPDARVVNNCGQLLILQKDVESMKGNN